MNPIQMIKGMMGINNPKEMVMQMLGQNNNNPIFNNLMNMANKGDIKGIENFARNLFKEQGKDFDAEFNKFKNMFK